MRGMCAFRGTSAGNMRRAVAAAERGAEWFPNRSPFRPASARAARPSGFQRDNETRTPKMADAIAALPPTLPPALAQTGKRKKEKGKGAEDARVRELVLLVEVSRLERAAAAAEIARLVETVRASQAQVQALVAIAEARTAEQRADAAFAESGALPPLNDAAGDFMRWPLGFFGTHGHHHLYSDPGMAWVFATSFGLLGLGMALDFVLFFLARLGAPGNRASLTWRCVRAGYTFFYAYLASEFSIRAWDLSTLPHPGAGAVGLTAGVAALWLARDLGTKTALFVWIACASLLFPHPKSKTGLDFSEYRGFFKLAWLFARGLGIGVWCSSSCTGVFAGLAPRHDAETPGYYRKWTPRFAWVSRACGIAHLWLYIDLVVRDRAQSMYYGEMVRLAVGGWFEHVW